MKKLILLLLLLPGAANAAITFVSGSYSGNNTATTRTLSEPSGAAQGDAVLVFCYAQGSSITWTDPADFTEISQIQTAAGSPIMTLYLGYKVRGATAGNALTFSHSGAADEIACQAVAYRGIDTGSPLDVAFVEASHYVRATNTTNLTPKPITTVTNDAMIVLFYGTTQGISGDAGAPSGYTEAADNLQSASTHNGIYVAHKIKATAGTDTPGAYTHTDVTGTADPFAYTIALKVISGPSFTAGPALGAATQTTLPTTFTTDQDGTVEGVACADGLAAPSVSQVFADQCGDGNAAAASFDEAVVDGIADGETFTGLTAGTTYDLYFAIDGISSDSNSVATLLNQVTVAVPTFSPALATGTLTSTTAQITGTASQSGTWYGLACTNGQTASVAQVKTGTTCSGGAAVAAFNKSVTGADSQTFTGLSAATTYDTFHVISNSAGDSVAIALADVTTQAAAAPSFTSGPTVVAAANGYTISGTISCTGTCSVEAVACNPGDVAPSANEIEAGQCGGGNSAILNAQENWTTTVADSFTLTGSNKPPRLSVYVSGTNGANDTAVVPFLNSDRTIRSGYSIVAMSSHASDGLCGLDDYFEPDCDDGDVFEYENTANNHSNCVVNIATDGRLTYYDHTDGQDTGAGETGDSADDGIDDCGGQVSFELSYQDISSDTDGLFPVPASGDFTTDESVYVNNAVPTCAPEPALQKVLNISEAMTTVDLQAFGNCEDEDDDSLTYSVNGLPSGTSLSGTGNKDWGGTPDTLDDAGTLRTVTLTDPAGDSTTYEFTSFVVDAVGAFTMPDCDSKSLSECQELVVAAAPWRADDTGLIVDGFVCGTGQPFLTIADQDPNAGGTVEAFEEISVDLVAAIVPDLTGMTAAEAIAAIEALCP